MSRYILADGVSLYSKSAEESAEESLQQKEEPNPMSQTNTLQAKSLPAPEEADKPFSEVFAKDFNAREALVCFMWRKAGKTAGGRVSGSSGTLFHEMRAEGIPFTNSKQVDNALRRAYVAKQIFLIRRGESSTSLSTYTVNELSRKMYDRVMSGTITPTGKAAKYDTGWRTDTDLQELAPTHLASAKFAPTHLASANLASAKAEGGKAEEAEQEYFDADDLPDDMLSDDMLSDDMLSDDMLSANVDDLLARRVAVAIDCALPGPAGNAPETPLEARTEAAEGQSAAVPCASPPLRGQGVFADKETFALMLMELISDGADSAKHKAEAEMLDHRAEAMERTILTLQSEAVQMQGRLAGALHSLEVARAAPKPSPMPSDVRRHLKHLHYLLGQMSDLHGARNFEGQTFRNLTNGLKDFQEDDFLTLLNAVGGILQDKN